VRASASPLEYVARIVPSLVVIHQATKAEKQLLKALESPPSFNSAEIVRFAKMFASACRWSALILSMSRISMHRDHKQAPPAGVQRPALM